MPDRNASGEASPELTPAEAFPRTETAAPEPFRGGEAEQLVQAGASLVPLWLTRFSSEATRRAYRSDLEQFFGTDYVPLALARQVTHYHIDAHLEGMDKKEGLALSTQKRRLTALRSFFRWCVAKEYLEQNPADQELVRKLPALRPEDRSVVYLSRSQARRLVEAAAARSETTGTRDRALLVTLIYLCLRRSEAAQMQTGHFARRGEHTVLLLPRAKGGRPGEVKVQPAVLKAIRRWDDLSGESRPLWRSLSNRNRGEAITPNMIYRIARRAAEAAGLSETLGAHALRHTGCTLALEGGASIEQVQRHARHRSVNTTMQYLHTRRHLEENAGDYIKL